MEHTPKTFQAINVHSQKFNKPLDGFFTHLFFTSSNNLIFGGLFLHRLSRLLKLNFNCIRVPTTDFAKKKSEPGGRTQIQVCSVGRQDISLPKATPKIHPLFYVQFQNIGYPTYAKRKTCLLTR